MPDSPAVLASREYAEAYLTEDAVLQAARQRGDELGCVPIGPGGGAALRFLAAATNAKAVVEVGTGAGSGSASTRCPTTPSGCPAASAAPSRSTTRVRSTPMCRPRSTRCRRTSA